MRIDKLLANMGYGTRKEVKTLLKGGNVRINGNPEKSAKTHVNPEEDQVTVMGEEVEYKKYIYLMMNKPGDLISATEDANDMTVIDILQPEDQVFDPFPVGRLDKDTEGLLLITNDGQLNHRLTSPNKGVGKTYFAEIDGKVVEDDVKEFASGVTLDDGYKTKPGELIILKSDDVSEIELTISEGKFHQVKRMFEAVGKSVTYLKRIKVGTLELDEDLELGEYRELTDDEIGYLRGITNLESE
ncbi:ribosomal small subunit pseudouridine synthase A [Halobacillus dabanensis]|uniref:Pseudouridine synthase n=1 Tax=Halobacillus dabanensis TaxID=240302 RepID=A0A1I3NLL9_HALDA|nr:pseudouridine synthase [Halobacillus dabanensis]SFJ10248.1 ribosomal small subunit pseudouridine synthase A [Halobacillus dabanensis]